ncbi:oxalate decarboxylase/phosphoglucose isomerase-like protein (cupin superfamily) [Pedobacter sp. CG_S7]|uniref:sugar 3,4-ketoisomerase n=1 Tax=Pedobacter sp. CG_S7 TaxID=3143930 RepID=UPI0033942C62
MYLNKNTVLDCKIIELPKIHNRDGNLTAINSGVEVPFNIKRVYYLYDIPGGEMRGAHAHFELEQLIIAASGSFDVILDDGVTKKSITLNRPYYGLYIKPGIWRDLVNFSSGSVLLVLASLKYSENDYIRDYNSFLNLKNGNN